MEGAWVLIPPWTSPVLDVHNATGAGPAAGTLFVAAQLAVNAASHISFLPGCTKVSEENENGLRRLPWSDGELLGFATTTICPWVGEVPLTLSGVDSVHGRLRRHPIYHFSLSPLAGWKSVVAAEGRRECIRRTVPRSCADLRQR